MDNIEGFLGIARKAGKLDIGEEAVAEAARLRRARLIMTASDASERACRHARTAAEGSGAVYISLPYTKAELGAAVGRGSPGIMAVTDIGIAEAIAGRLEQSSPEEYGPAAEKLGTKRRRMLERRQARTPDGGRTTGKRRTGK